MVIHRQRIVVTLTWLFTGFYVFCAIGISGIVFLPVDSEASRDMTRYPTVPPLISITDTTTEKEVSGKSKTKSKTSESSGKIQIYTHKGGKSLSPKALKSTITAVLTRLSSLPEHSAEFRDLIYETVKVESTLGKNIVGKSALGIAQVTPGTANAYIKRLKKNKPKLYKELYTLYDSKWSFARNLKENVPFNLGVCAIIYWERAQKSVVKASTLKQRAKIWKKHYNTHQGAGSVAIYVAKNTKS